MELGNDAVELGFCHSSSEESPEFPFQVNFTVSVVSCLIPDTFALQSISIYIQRICK
jgi:hypothetical protein